MRAPSTLDRLSLYFLWSGPAFGRTQNEQRPTGPLRGAFDPRAILNYLDLINHFIQNHCHLAMHGRRLIARQHARRIAVAGEQMQQLFFGNTRQQRWVGDFVAV